MYLSWGLWIKILRSKFCFYGFTFQISIILFRNKRFETRIFLGFSLVFWNLFDREVGCDKKWRKKENHNWFIILSNSKPYLGL